jgi:tetratricopeptide (TPR) repeat protein
MQMPPRLFAASSAIALMLAMQPAVADEYKALLKAKKFAEVERAASTRLAQEPANADAMVARTSAILRSGNETRIPEAVKQAEQCVAARAADARCHVVLGKALGAKALNGGMMSAMSYAGTIRDSFKKGVELDPRNLDARFSLMQFYLVAPGIMGGGSSKAEALVAQTVPLHPEAAKLMQAMLDMREDRMAKAEAAALAVRAGADEDLLDLQEEQLVSISAKYMTEKKYAEAERLARETLKRFPDSENGPYIVARIQQEQGKHREALAAFEQALVKTARPHIHYRMGQSLQALGDKAKAIAAYEKALAFKSGLSKKFRSDAEEQLKTLKG